MDYGEIISRGWRITWNNKFLWVLGFLAALGSGSSASSNGNVTQQFDGSEFDPEIFAAIGAAIALIVCLVLIIGLVLWLVSLVAKGGLISAVARLDDGEKVTLGEAFGAGTNRVWSLVGLSLALWGPFVILIILGAVAAGFALAGTAGGAAATGAFENGDPEAFLAAFGTFFACFGLLVCLLVPVAIVLQFIHAFAYRGLMLRGLGAIDSIRHGWAVLRANTSEILLLAVLFFVIGLLYGLAVLVVMLPLTLVLFIPIIGTAISGGDINAASIALIAGGAICLGIFGAVLNSILVTWRSATFTLAYREFTQKGLAKAQMA